MSEIKIEISDEDIMVLIDEGRLTLPADIAVIDPEPSVKLIHRGNIRIR